MPLASRSLILAKVETTYGTDAAPTAAADAIMASKPEIEISGSAKTRDVVLPYYGKLAPINVGEAINLKFSVEARGSGAAGTAPRISALLRACNMTMTTNAGVSNILDPNSAQDGESATIYFYRDGLLHKALGCVGTWKLTMKTNEIAMFDFEFTGLYAAGHASTVAFPSNITYDGPAVPPPIFRSAAFNLWGIGAANAIIESLSVDIGNVVSKRPDANAASGMRRYFISDREAKGECDPEVVALATYNPWALWDSVTAGAITATIGNAAGNRLLIDMPNVVKDLPKYGERETALTYGVSFVAKPTLAAGNNEVKLTFN